MMEMRGVHNAATNAPPAILLLILAILAMELIDYTRQRAIVQVLSMITAHQTACLATIPVTPALHHPVVIPVIADIKDILYQVLLIVAVQLDTMTLAPLNALLAILLA